jgi:hypothetical protein
MTDASNILIYQTEDGKTKIQTRLENETVWLSQSQMSELFQKELEKWKVAANNAAKDKKYAADIKEFGADSGGVVDY